MARLRAERDGALKDYLQVVAALPRVAELQRAAWLRDWQAGSAEAGRQLLESFLPVVVAEAAARRGEGSRFETLLAAGNRALAAALSDLRNEPHDLEKAVRGAVLNALKEEKKR